jgi:hypothetical protein
MAEIAELEACKLKVFPPAFWPIRMDTLSDHDLEGYEPKFGCPKKFPL